MNYDYNPFNKNLVDVEGDDLLVLKDVSEGWYIEYKSQSLKISDLAKHLSAFSNQYGGFLFIGIEEEDNKGIRTAGNFTGVDSSHIQKICTDIREASSAHTNPEVFYEEKIIQGPVEELGLEKGRSIIIIGIPKSFNTPHMHSKSGSIYIRVGDHSKPNTDRYQLDRLQERREKFKRENFDFFTSLPVCHPAQKGAPFFHFYHALSSFQTHSNEQLEFDEFRNISQAESGRNQTTYSKLDHVAMSPKGYIGRQITTNAPYLNTLTLEWFHKGVVRFDIPLQKLTLSELSDKYKNNPNAIKFINIMKNRHPNYHNDIQVIDFSHLILTLTSLTGNALYLFKAINEKRDILSCFMLKNVSHTFPFFDSEYFVNKVEKDMAPMFLDEVISFPEVPTEEDMSISSVNLDEVDIDDAKSVEMAIISMLLIPVARLLVFSGVLLDINDENEIASHLVYREKLYQDKHRKN